MDTGQLLHLSSTLCSPVPLGTQTLSGGAPASALRKDPGEDVPRSLGSEDTARTSVFPFILGETQNEKGEEEAEKCGVASLAGHVPVAQERPGRPKLLPAQAPSCSFLLGTCSVPCRMPSREGASCALTAAGQRNASGATRGENRLAPIQDGRVKGPTSRREAPCISSLAGPPAAQGNHATGFDHGGEGFLSWRMQDVLAASWGRPRGSFNHGGCRGPSAGSWPEAGKLTSTSDPKTTRLPNRGALKSPSGGAADLT